MISVAFVYPQIALLSNIPYTVHNLNFRWKITNPTKLC